MPEGGPRWSESESSMPPRNNLALAAIILGVVALLGLFLIGIVDAVIIIAGLVVGILAVRQVKRGESNRRGFAIAGVVLSAVALVLFVVFVIVNQRAVSDCKKKIGHSPSSSELRQCQKDKN